MAKLEFVPAQGRRRSGCERRRPRPQCWLRGRAGRGKTVCGKNKNDGLLSCEIGEAATFPLRLRAGRGQQADDDGERVFFAASAKRDRCFFGKRLSPIFNWGSFSSANGRKEKLALIFTAAKKKMSDVEKTAHDQKPKMYTKKEGGDCLPALSDR